MNQRRAMLLAAFVALLAHVGALRAELVYDDQVLLRDVPFLSDWGSLWRMWSPEWYWNAGELSWRPLTVVLQIAARCTLGNAPAALHAVSWLAHGAAAAMCVRWLCALGLPAGAALLGAAVLAAHPVGVEAVIIVTFIEDPLAALLLLWGGAVVARGPKGPAQAAALAAIALAAMGVKETGLLALPLWALSALGGAWARGERPTWRPWVPAIAAVATATVLFAVLRFGVYANPTASVPRIPGGLVGLAAADFWILGGYATVLLLPVRLCIDWTLPLGSAALGITWGVVASLGVAATAWLARRRAPGISLGLAFGVLALGPVMNLVPLSIPAAERFLYLSLAGLAWVVAAAFVASGADRDPAIARRWHVAGGVLLALWVIRDWTRSRDFASSAVLWEATAAVNPESARAGMMLADAVKQDPVRPDTEAAAELYRDVLAKWPGDQFVRLKLAVTLMELADARRTRAPGTPVGPLLTEAAELLGAQCERWPDDHTAWLARAQLSHMLGQPQLEQQMFERAIRAMPEAAMPYVQMANRLGQQGRFADALAALDRAPERARANPIYPNERVKLLAQVGRVDDAWAELQRALQRWPDHPLLLELAAHPGFQGRR